MLYHRIVDTVTLATLTRVTTIMSIAQILVQPGSTIGVLGHPWDCQGCHHGNMTLEFETGGQRLTTSGTTLNVQGSPGTEGGAGHRQPPGTEGRLKGTNIISETTLNVQGSLICVTGG